MINIVSRSLIFKNVSGPKKVVDNLIKGLDKIGYPYVLNKRLDYCSCLYIHDDRVALQEVKNLDPRIRVIVGPNLYVVPRDLPHSLDISRAVYLVPSEWNKRFWLHFGFDKCPMEAWGAGIDTEEFSPNDNKKEFILLYFKQRFNEELERVETALKEKNLEYKLLHYDKGYRENEFKDLLKKSRYVIWLGRQESQGIALQEILSSNIPVIVCDVSSVGHCLGGGELNQEEKDYTDTSSASYFDDRCGIKIKDLNTIGDAIDEMEKKLDSFVPREYILENLTLEGQAKKLIGFYEKYFHISYSEGLEEKPLHLGNWINARWNYVLYLKLKHWCKILLVKLGLWNTIFNILGWYKSKDIKKYFFIQESKDELEKKYSTTLEHSFVNERNRSEEMRKFPAHWERYEFAKNYVKGKRVLDIACGSGYGTDILSVNSGIPAIGLDIDGASIEWASHYFGKKSSFLQIKNENLWPVEGNSIDVVVSFETIEHVKNVNSFLSEVHRVLKPGGIFIISTPLNESKERFSPENRFHIREYNWNELDDLLSDFFIPKKSFSQFSNLGVFNTKINRSPLFYIKKITPPLFKKNILKCFQKLKIAKSGKIIEGKVIEAGVQLRIVIKK